MTLRACAGSMRLPNVSSRGGVSMAEQTTLTGRGAELAIRIGLLVLLVGWCFVIVRPFIGMIGWAIVMSVAMYPTFERLRTLLGGRTKTAAALP